MACTPKEFKERKTREALELLYNSNSPAYKLHPKTNPNSIIITPASNSKINTVDKAYKASQTMMKKLEDAYGEDYMFKTFGHWGTVYQGPNDIRVEIKIPDNLIRAYEVKQDSQRNIDYFNSDTALYEQEQREMAGFFDLPKQTEDQLNFNAYIKYKKEMLKRTNKAILSLKSLRTHDKSKELASKIRNLEAIQTKLSQDIQTLMDSETIFEDTIAFIDEDLKIIDELLSNNNIDNLHTAEKMIGFYERMADIEHGSPNPFINTEEIYDEKGNLVLEPDVINALNKLRDRIHGTKDSMGLKSRLIKAKKSYLQDLVDNSSHIQSLFPEMEVNEMLQDIKDIDVASQFFLTIDKQFVSQDSLLSQLMKIELERSRSRNKSFVADIKSRMDAILPAVKKKLPKIVSVPYWFGKSFVENDWSIFYQQTSNGNKTGRIVDKFSPHWFKTFNNSMGGINKMYFSAIKNKDWNKVNTALEKKYKWLNNHADFIDVSKLPEVIRRAEYRDTYGLTMDGADDYKQSLIDRVGEKYYNKIVEKQLEQLEDFQNFQEEYIESLLLDHNVDTFDELPDVVKFSAEVTFLRNNPFELIKSHKANQNGRVDYISGNSSRQYQSNVKYIEFIPKEEINVYDFNKKKTVSVPSKYYDNNFRQIEQDPDLFKFWEILEESTTFINMTVADSEHMLKHGSILSMKKSFWDILIDPSTGIGNKFISLSSELKGNLKDLFTSNAGNKIADDFDDINKSQFKSNEEEVYKRAKILLLKLSKILGDEKMLTRPISLEKAPQDFIDVFAKEFGLPKNRNEFMREIGVTLVIPNKLVKELTTNQVVNEQTLNLPVLLRAYLEMTAEYKSQKESQPQLSIYKQFYEAIKRETTNIRKDRGLVMKAIDSITNSDSLKTERVRANRRLNHWYNRNVLGNNDQNEWINFGKIDWLSYDKYERELKKELEDKLKDPELDDEERVIILNQIENLGANVTFAAIYNSMINRFNIWKGLAYSVKSNVINRFQGWYQGQVYDTGRFWTAGNFHIANDFIMKKGLRHVPGNKRYRQEIEKVKLLINELNILQDATNEIDRARNESGLTGVAKKVQPFYLTEYTEWHNQTPQILSMLMDKSIMDKDGNEVAIFNGKELVPYEITDGLLKLKEEFRTPENIETWEKFSNDQASDNKLYMSEVIGIINGDYSRTGTTYVKKGNIGKTAMMFKTWMPNNIWSRIAASQPNLVLGKKEVKGIYTSHRPLTLGTTLGSLGLLTAGVPFALAGAGIGVGVSMVLAKKHNRELEFNLKGAAKVADTAQALLKKMIGLPLNTISGKQIVKEHNLGNLTVSQEDKQNLNSILNELSVLLSFVLFKIMIKALLGPNDEEEPKTADGKKMKNPYYPGNPQSEREKMMHNVLENEITRIIGDITLYENPNALYESTIQRNAIYQTLEDVKKLSSAVQKWNQGLDELQTGPNRGESRLWNQTKRMFLPNIMQSPFTLGYEKSMEQEYDKTEFFDSYFYSDYKKDKKLARANRTQARQELTEDFKKSYNWDDLDPQSKIIVEDLIEKEVDKVLKYSEPYPNRLMYDENQEAIK